MLVAWALAFPVVAAAESAGRSEAELGTSAESTAPVVAAVELRVDGELRQSTEVESWIEVEPGQPLDVGELRRTLRNLHASGLFSRLEAVSRPGAEPGRIVVMLLADRPSVAGELRFEGDLQLFEARLRRRFRQRERAPLETERMDEGVASALELYRQRGHYEATVTWRRQPSGRDGIEDVIVEVEAGPRTRLGEVSFSGDVGPYGHPELIEALRLGERFDAERIDESAERLRLFLVERGHLSATVEPASENYDHRRAALDLDYGVDAGPLFEVETRGVERRWLERRGFLPLEERPLAEPLLNQGCLRLRDALQAQGHFHAWVECRIEDLSPTGPEAALGVTRRLIVEVERGGEYEVAEVRFEGNELIPEQQLEPLVRLGPRRPLRFGSGRLVSRELQADLENLRSFYLLQGFLDVEIAPVQIREETAGELTVVIQLEENTRRRVVGVEIEGVTAFEPADLLARLPLQPGGGYHPLRVEDAVNAVRTIYEEEGYPSTVIESQLDWDTGEELVDIRLVVEEGEPRMLDRLVLRGLQRTRPRLVEAYTDLESGETLSRRKLLEAERELYRLGIFSEADVALVPSTGDLSERSVAVRVEEGRRWRLSYGLSYHSDDGIGGLLGLSRVNLRGLGERLQLDLRTSENDSRLRLFYDQPMPFGVKLPLTWTLFFRNETRPTYEVDESGFRAQVARDVESRIGRVRLGLLYDYRLVELTGDLFDPRFIEREDREAEISSVAPNVLIDRRDDPLDPTRGWSLAAQVEYAFPFIDAEANYLKLFAQYTRYLELGDFGTLAGSVRLGLVEALGDPVILDTVLPPELDSSRIPISERFFAGGRTTHRAYERDSLGLLGQSLIQDENGRIFEVGGNGLFLLNLDYRFPISGAIGGVAFLDLGNVWADWRDLELEDLRPGIGLGIRYASPVGPVRLEIGWKLDAQDFEDDAPIFLLSFGNPF